jgi:uncharacterized membrane protein YGL010W
MASLSQLFQEYGESHQHPRNKLIHNICVPLIEWSLLGMLWEIHASPLLIVAALIYYMQFRNWKVILVSLMMTLPFLDIRQFKSSAYFFNFRDDLCLGLDRTIRWTPDRRQKTFFLS